MTRRMQHYDVPKWRPWMILSAFGVLVMLGGVICQLTQLVVSIRNRDELRDETGDPWNACSFEWSTPPPAFNFATMPNVENEEPYWQIKQRDGEPAARGRAALRADTHAA